MGAQLWMEFQIIHKYSNAIYDEGGNTITCDFPIKFFTNSDYLNIEYKIYLMSSLGGKATIEIGNKGIICNFDIQPEGNILFTINITPPGNLNVPNTLNIKCEHGDDLKGYTDISTIKFSLINAIVSPAIAMYTATLTTNGNKSNMSLEGINICSTTNPCLPHYTCGGGQCLECDPTCLYCDTEKSRTGCIKMCSPHTTTPTPSMGQCLLNYVDVTQPRSEEGVPKTFALWINGVSPPRTNRITMTLWIFFSKFVDPL